MKRFLVCTAIAIASLTTLALESDAQACGGCFGPPPPPTESPTVVTDHRMILSISKDKSTLYDQIRYTGSPSSFAWVLPIAGTVDVGISADIVFTALDGQTQTQLIAPPQNCPPLPSGCARGGFSSSSGGSAGAPANDQGGVQVIKQEVVGPYETVQLKVIPDGGGTANPEVLNQWLAQNGYTVPDDVKPVIAKYVEEKFNFLALKLVPGKGVQDMRPVRVTTSGAGAVLPLRMVAAGTGPVVGITLWVVSEGRYEPQNFTSFTIDTNELVWDWTQLKSNYVDLRAQKTAAGNGRAWETESSRAIYAGTIESIVRNGTYSGGQFPTTDEERAAQDYLAETDDQGNVTKTASQVRAEDMAALFNGIQTARVTRMRADLAHAALDQDLQLIASANQAELPNVRQITKELNQPQCPVYDGCNTVGTAPRDEAIARSTPAGSGTGSSCAVAPPSGNTSLLAAGFGVGVVALVQLAQRRRRRPD